MIVLSLSSGYKKTALKFVKNDQNRADLISKALKLFEENPKHPGLNVEKLKNSDYYSMRIDKNNRIFFMWYDSKTAILLDVGKHDKYKEY